MVDSNSDHAPCHVAHQHFEYPFLRETYLFYSSPLAGYLNPYSNLQSGWQLRGMLGIFQCF